MYGAQKEHTFIFEYDGFHCFQSFTEKACSKNWKHDSKNRQKCFAMERRQLHDEPSGSRIKTMLSYKNSNENKKNDDLQR